MKQNYVISIPVSVFWKFLVPLGIFSILVCTLVGILVVDRLVMPRVVRVDRGWVTVPDLHGLPYEKARQKLYNVGLRLSVQDRVYHVSVPEKCVISQDPSGEERVNTSERRGVSAVMSKGPEVAEVPLVLDMTEHHAKREIRKHGFAVGTVSTKYSDRIPKDMVISVSPRAGTLTSREAPIDMMVSKGVEPTHATVPNVIGEMLSSAKEALEENGLKPGKIDYRRSVTSAPGSVLSQGVSPGASVPLSSSVSMVVCAEKAGSSD